VSHHARASRNRQGPRAPRPASTGTEERFLGYGIMGLPFRTGHVLGLRRFPASSVGHGYRSVWHRDPRGRWTFYQDQPAELTCTRYFGSEVDDVREGPIQIEWTRPRRLRVRAGDGELKWIGDLGSTIATRLFNGVGSALPARAWRSPAFLQGMSRIAGLMLRAGRIRLTGLTPNGQRFVANPSTLWIMACPLLSTCAPTRSPGQSAPFKPASGDHNAARYVRKRCIVPVDTRGRPVVTGLTPPAKRYQGRPTPPPRPTPPARPG
jgi:hypothetical protein